jgi:hypothetical protein
MTISRESIEGGYRPGFSVACRTCTKPGDSLYYLADTQRIVEENGYAEYLAVRHDDLYHGNHDIVIYKYTGSPKAE